MSFALDPIPIGYFAKWIVERPEWLNVPNVEDICSVSECMSAGPDDWFSLWKHNALCLFDDEQVIADIASELGRPEPFDLFAYALIPIRFAADGEAQITLAELPNPAGPAPNAASRPLDYERLGFDCVQTGWHDNIVGFGCSPLSCNGRAAEIPVNRHCLIDRLDDAIEAARRFAKEQPEPGVYYVVEVWRKRRGGSAA
jgi:hypothetical protein